MYEFSENTFSIDDFMSTINSALPSRIVLFGAAGWGTSLYDELKARQVSAPVIFTDNDTSKHGRKLKNIPIIPPDKLDVDNDIVVITSISAGDQISSQLEEIGFQRNVNYFEVMNNLNFGQPFDVFGFYHKFVSGFTGLDILHIGPGGHLFVELLLAMSGANSVSSVEYNSFGIQFPDITSVKGFYDKFTDLSIDRRMGNPYENKFIIKEGDRFVINRDKINLYCPISVTGLPFEDGTFDLVLHHAVFEHVRNPEKGYREIFRTLKQGGRTIGLVGPIDHRTYSAFEDFHPLKFLELERREWYELSKKMNFHNQVTTPEHKEMIRNQGFQILKWDIHEHLDITDAMLESFHPMFTQFDRHELGILLFGFSALKQ